MEVLHEFIQWVSDILTFLGLVLGVKDRQLPQTPPQPLEESPDSPQPPSTEVEAPTVEADVTVIIVILVIDENT